MKLVGIDFTVMLLNASYVYYIICVEFMSMNNKCSYSYIFKTTRCYSCRLESGLFGAILCIKDKMCLHQIVNMFASNTEFIIVFVDTISTLRGAGRHDPSKEDNVDALEDKIQQLKLDTSHEINALKLQVS